MRGRHRQPSAWQRLTAWLRQLRTPLHSCQHRDRDCDDLACPCLCERCIEDRLAIYSTMPGRM